jgi:hypothetical protein
MTAFPTHDKDKRPSNPNKVGWREPEWSKAIGISRAKTYELLSAGEIASVKLGAARIITTSPEDFLASLASKAAKAA